MSVMSYQLCILSISKKQACAAICTTSARSYSSREIQVIKNPDPAALKRGTGGRSSFSGIVATVFGASGFLGRYVCNKLGKIGSQIIIPYRTDFYDVKHLKLVGDLGQVLFQPYHLQNRESIMKAMKHSNVVINLIGREWETKNFKYNDVHHIGAREIAAAAKECGVERLIHVSALNLCENPQRFVLKTPCDFFPSKWRGEQAVLDVFPEATIFRPSDIYGQEDRFLRYYSWHSRRTGRWMALWKKGEATVKQPVYCGDFAQGIVTAVKDPTTKGKIYQAVGPQRYLLSDFMDYLFRVLRRDSPEWGYRRFDIKWDPTVLMKARFYDRVLPDRPMQHLTVNRVEREFVSDDVSLKLPTLEDLGVNLTVLENQVPWEVRQYRAYNYYDDELGEFPDPAPPKTVPFGFVP